MISGTTTLVAHLGYPTHTFKSSLICNPWFEKNGIDAVVRSDWTSYLAAILLACLQCIFLLTVAIRLLARRGVRR